MLLDFNIPKECMRHIYVSMDQCYSSTFWNKKLCTTLKRRKMTEEHSTGTLVLYVRYSMARFQERFLRKGRNSYLQEVVDDLADLGLGEAVLGEVVNGGVDPPFSSLGPRPPHRLGRCGSLLMAERVNLECSTL
jgi:hypothetical protein